MNPNDIIPIVATSCFFGTVTLSVLIINIRRMVELKLKGGSNQDSALAEEIRDLKQQLAEMRDTTTRYDVSFDSALQRIESRMGNVEQRVTAVERQGETVPLNRG